MVAKDPDRPFNSDRSILFAAKGYVVVRGDDGVEVHDRRIYFDPNGKDSYLTTVENREEAWAWIRREGE